MKNDPRTLPSDETVRARYHQLVFAPALENGPELLHISWMPGSEQFDTDCDMVVTYICTCRRYEHDVHSYGGSRAPALHRQTQTQTQTQTRERGLLPPR